MAGAFEVAKRNHGSHWLFHRFHGVGRNAERAVVVREPVALPNNVNLVHPRTQWPAIWGVDKPHGLETKDN